MKARHIAKLRKEIHHYRMYRLYTHSGPSDISKNELDKQSYEVIYGKTSVDAIRRYCKKRPNYLYHLTWLRFSDGLYPNLMILEEGKPYRFRQYFDW